MASHRQHDGGRAGRRVEHHTDLERRPIGSERQRLDGQPTEHRPLRPGAVPVPGALAGPDGHGVIGVGIGVGRHPMPLPRSGRILAAVTGGADEEPSCRHGQPLLSGPAEDGPEGQGHADGQADHCHQDPDHGGTPADGQHADDQTVAHGSVGPELAPTPVHIVVS